MRNVRRDLSSLRASAVVLFFSGLFLLGAKECSPPDADSDGYDAAAGDCDDHDAWVYPNATEQCNGLDDDCDGWTDEVLPLFLDRDGDGFGTGEARDGCLPATGYVSARGDCDDANPDVYPGALEVPGDGKDWDCGGSDGLDAHVGLSGTSLQTIESALEAALPGTTIWVGPGTYYEHSLSTAGKAVKLMSTGLAEQTTVEASGGGRIFSFTSSESQSTVVDGFTLRGGDADLDVHPGLGGAVLAISASPRLVGCTITHNQATLGGGVYLEQSYLELRDSSVHFNDAAEKGGGIHAVNGGPKIVNSTISNNSAAYDAGGMTLYSDVEADVSGTTLANNRIGENGYYGGAVYIYDSSPVFDGCLFSGSSSPLEGGAVYVLEVFSTAAPRFSNCVFKDNGSYFGGAISLREASLTLERSSLMRNNGTEGGALYAFGSTIHLEHVAFTENSSSNLGGGLTLAASSLELSYAILSRNTATESGGGLYFVSSYRSGSLSVDQCVFSQNEAGQGGGLSLFAQEPISLAIHDSVFSENASYNIYGMGLLSAITPSIRYNDLYVSSGDNYNISGVDSSNVSVPPQFLEEGAGDFHLFLTSPLIGSADPAVYDLDGTRGDLGVFGGPGGGEWDQDRDGVPAYFWPGDYADAPSSVDVNAYDSDDQDPMVQ